MWLGKTPVFQMNSASFLNLWSSVAWLENASRGKPVPSVRLLLHVSSFYDLDFLISGCLGSPTIQFISSLRKLIKVPLASLSLKSYAVPAFSVFCHTSRNGKWKNGKHVERWNQFYELSFTLLSGLAGARFLGSFPEPTNRYLRFI